MFNLNQHYQVFAGLFIFIFGLHFSSLAQSVWVQENDIVTTAGVELMVPSFDEVVESEFPSAAFLLYTQIEVGENIGFKASLPVSHFAVSFSEMSETGIGNPYLGVKFFDISQGLDLDLGLRIPLASKQNFGLLTGALIENYNFGTYMSETFSITSALSYHWQGDSGLIIKAGGGPDVIKPNNGDTELFTTYYGQVLYGTNGITVGAGITGLVIITESDLSFGDRSIHDFGFLGSFNFGAFQTDAYLRIPLEESSFNYVLGLNFKIPL